MFFFKLERCSAGLREFLYVAKEMTDTRTVRIDKQGVSLLLL